MIQPNPQENNYTLLLLEAGFVLVAIAGAFAFPRMLSGGFRRVENSFNELTRRKTLACVTVGASMLLLRLAMLPLFPAPHPFLPDDFSFLLAGDTFAHGRLANPPPALWTHFESLQISVQPTYASMYFPATGLVLAAGKVLLGHPWAGLLIASSLMCAAICWMLQAWLPPGWALLGGFLSVLRIGLFSYWTNTYTGGGNIAPPGQPPPGQPISALISSWVGFGNLGTQRAAITAQLERIPGNHMVFVRYAPQHDSINEWVYNAADIDRSRVIWAQEMDPGSNADLVRHYSDRDVWLVQPDVQNDTLSPYSPDPN
ncbi:MAG TPA: hypothetical protein VG225_13285 [Terracidiphilus sp.]|jgi:hypothetical protein|nr:hypothetical protein [Terracidiphilus sp.]